MLPATRRTLEDAHVSRLDHVETRAGFTFTEHDLTGGVMARYGALGEKHKLILCQSREDLDFRERLTDVDGRFRHAINCTQPCRNSANSLGPVKRLSAANAQGLKKGQ